MSEGKKYSDFFRLQFLNMKLKEKDFFHCRHQTKMIFPFFPSPTESDSTVM